MQKKRYWGLATLSIIWIFANVLVSAETGRTGMGVGDFMWLPIAFYAIAGNIVAVASIAKWVSIFQAVIGTIVFFVLNGNSDMQLYFGAPAEFAVGVGFSILLWAILYFWAIEKVKNKSDNLMEQGHVETTSASTINASKSKTAVPVHPALSIDSRPEYSMPFADQAKAAQILLKYDEDVQSTIQKLDGLPAEIIEQVLISIVENPNESSNTVSNIALLNALGRPDMNWSEEFDLIIRKCKDASVDDVREFFRVFPVLSKRMAPIEVFRKSITEKISEFHVTTASGNEILVTQYGTNSFAFELYNVRKIFATLDEVYDYLRTPENKRK